MRKRLPAEAAAAMSLAMIVTSAPQFWSAIDPSTTATGGPPVRAARLGMT
jgi:hypothetical protein